MLGVDGEWGDDAGAKPLTLARVANLDRALLRDAWTLLARRCGAARAVRRHRAGAWSKERCNSSRLATPAAMRAVNWQRSSGTLKLAQLATSGEDAPRLAAGGGTLEFARGGTQLSLDRGADRTTRVITGARLDWPRSGAPRLHASLEGAAGSPPAAQRRSRPRASNG